jgi:hypothetical protein
VLLRPKDTRTTRGLVVVLAGLASAYVMTRLVALPPLDPDREAFDITGVVTVAVELLGVFAGLLLSSGAAAQGTPRLPLEQGGSR